MAKADSRPVAGLHARQIEEHRRVNNMIVVSVPGAADRPIFFPRSTATIDQTICIVSLPCVYHGFCHGVDLDCDSFGIFRCWGNTSVHILLTLGQPTPELLHNGAGIIDYMPRGSHQFTLGGTPVPLRRSLCIIIHALYTAPQHKVSHGSSGNWGPKKRKSYESEHRVYLPQ